jgi:putative ABC transport system permease protein
MLELIFANLRVRPFRTIISVLGISLGVILVVMFTGLAKGMTADLAKRASNWKAEIVFTRPGGMDSMSSNASVPVAYAQRLLQIEGVASTVPMFQYVSGDSRGTWGIKKIDGVDWQPYAAMNDIRIVEGRAAEAVDEVVLDQRQLADDKLKIGDTYELFGGRPYKIVGVFAPPSGARIKMSLKALQTALERDGKCSYILVKVKEGADPAAVAARINEDLPGNKVSLTRDLIIDAQERIPGLNTFLRVLVVLGAVVSIVFVLLSMYTTITERRREIGILKSLGTSKGFIIKTIEGEAFVIGVLGVIFGFAVALVASYVLERSFNLVFEFNPNWMVAAIAIGILGSLAGALYPAWRASTIDPVEVMVNE